LSPQKNQKGFQQKGFLAAQGLCPANQVKPGLQTIAPKPHISAATAKFPMPFQRTGPPLFCLISAEAGLLT
jgi:hypothetical protein